MIPHITFDIQLEIVKRLPVKSLIQFRSVCKSWKSFIDSSEFIAGYSVPHTQPQHLLVKYEVGDRRETELKCVCFVDDDTFPQQTFVPTVPSLLEELHRARIIDSSHGVLCFYGFYHRKPVNVWLNSVTHMALLWNPSIRKSTGVVVPSVESEHFSSVLGFGVCPDTCDPMLVYITYIWSDPRRISYIPWQVMVFTLSSGEWEILCDNLPRKSIAFSWSSTVIGQFIYWFAYDRIEEDGGLGFRNLIMSFDMVSDEFIEIDLPDSLAHLPDDLEHMPELAFSVSRLRESLVVLEYDKNTSKRQVCGVWMMEDGDPKSFTKLFTIKAPDAGIKRTLGFTKNGEAIIEQEYEFGGWFFFDGALVVYEPCTNHIKNLEIYYVTENSASVNSYTESLLLLHEDDLIYVID